MPRKEVNPVDEAAEKARAQYLQNQAFQMMTMARALRTNMFMAVGAEELSPQVKGFLWQELNAALQIVKPVGGETI